MRNLGTILSIAVMAGTLMPLSATPIRPDIRKLVSEPGENATQFAPARAGWNGPEVPTTHANSMNPAVERLSPAATARAAKASLVAAALPDWRILLAILAVIGMLRYFRRKTTLERVPDSNQIRAEERLRPAA